jgi:hypothetical protein
MVMELSIVCESFCLNIIIVPIPGPVDVRNFQKGLYRCGKKIISEKAGMPCKTFHDCPSSIAGVYA